MLRNRPKVHNLTPESARVWVTRPGDGVVWFRAPPDLDLLLDDGESVFALLPFLKQLHDANRPMLAEQIDLANITEDLACPFVTRAGPPLTVKVDGERRQNPVPYPRGRAKQRPVARTENRLSA